MSKRLRKITQQVLVGNVKVGGGAPIVVQSMTNTDTVNIKATVNQIIELATAGSEIVRITVNSEEAAAAVAPIKEQLIAQNCFVPIVGDFHFNGHNYSKNILIARRHWINIASILVMSDAVKHAIRNFNK